VTVIHALPPSIPKQSLSLLTDFYQLTMCFGYWKKNLHQDEAVFHLFFRRTPFRGGFTVAAGLESVINYLENFRFEAEDLDYLATLRGPDEENYFEQGFLDYLSQLKFTGEIDAVPEGTVVFPYEPLLRIQAPLIQCQLLESPLLNLINFPTLIATKAARICLAAQGEKVLEFGLRRAQGIDGALTASRSAYIGGCHSTSNVLAGKLFNIPVGGTHSHSWVMVFDDELEAFQAYAEVLPNNCIFLVDTYDTIAGVKKAIEVGKWLKQQGKIFLGIRLDSGDLAELSIKSRHLLDQAGFQEAVIVASNELDETLISELKRQGAQINVWGVGTNLITAKDQPALDGVYKLSAIRKPGQAWKYKLKLSEQMVKVSNPGILQVKRFSFESENIADVIYNIKTDLKNDCVLVDPLDPTKERVLKEGVQGRDLLQPIFRAGACIYALPTLDKIRSFVQQELKGFSVGVKRFLNPHLYIVGMEKSLYDLKIQLMKQVRHSSTAPSHD
jgi:nicotinate phosphoribosyltransferase